MAICKIPALVISDCKSVVSQIRKYVDEGIKPKDSPAPELWDFLYDALDTHPAGYFEFQWMPSHLDDPKRAKQRQKYLQQKFASTSHILGNVHADKLADNGARRHNIDPLTIAHATDRTRLTELVQWHLILSWDAWIAHTSGIAENSSETSNILSICDLDNGNED